MKKLIFTLMCITLLNMSEFLISQIEHATTHSALQTSKKKKRRSITQAAQELEQQSTEKNSSPTPLDPETNSESIEQSARPLTDEEQDQPIFLKKFLDPWEFGDPDKTLEFNFDNAELSNFIEFIEQQFELTFILDDALKPLPQGGKSTVGTKISFATHKPLSKKDGWAIFLSFLDMSGLAIEPGPTERVYRITTNDPRSPLSVNKGPLPTFIGTDPSQIPSDDTRIRYVYFVENTSIDVIKNVLDSLRSSTSPNLIIVPELRALIATDKAYNIKAMLEVVKELDRVTMPESMTVIKLKRADASKVAELYKALTQENQQSLATRLLGGRKPSTASYFPEGTRVIAEPRTNTLILLGTIDAIKRIETFITKEIDREVDVKFSPFFVYRLKYVEAENVANILREVLTVQPEGTDAAKFGGVRNGDKFFKPVTITPEKTSNSLIIFADYEDRLKITDAIDKIDIELPQVALKCAFLSVDINDNKDLGIQMRNKVGPTLAHQNNAGISGLIGNNVTFQTSGLGGSPVIENSTGPGADRLLGNLVKLALVSTTPGTTYISLGSDAYDVWGMLRMLESYSNVSVIATPFMITTHKYPGKFVIGETRRILTGVTQTTSGPVNSFDDLSANLDVQITPQISHEGLITLDINVEIDQFTSTDISSGNRTEKNVKTAVIMNNQETIAFGGLIKDQHVEIYNKVPILGDIPLLGWFFKYKAKALIKSSLLLIIQAEIIPVKDTTVAQNFTQEKIQDSLNLNRQMRSYSERLDPVHRWFFKDCNDVTENGIKTFASAERNYDDPSIKSKIQKKSILSAAEKAQELGTAV